MSGFDVIGQSGFVSAVLHGAPTFLRHRPQPVDLLIEDDYGAGTFRPVDPRVRIVRVNRGMDGTPSTAVIQTGLDVADLSQGQDHEPVGRRHFSHLLDELSPDLRILAVQSNGEGEPKYLFDGYIQTRTIHWSASDQSFTATLVDAASERLKTDRQSQNIGRFMRDSEAFAWSEGDEDNFLHRVRALPLHFNAGGRPNRSANAVRVRPFAGDDEPSMHWFTEDDAPGAGYWTYAQALRYVVYTMIIKGGQGVYPLNTEDFWADLKPLMDASFSSDDKNSFRRRITQRIKDLRIDACSADETIAQLVVDAGMHYEYQLRAVRGEDGQGEGTWRPEHRLRIFAVLEDDEEAYDLAMGRPQQRSIPRAAPFSTVISDGPNGVQNALKANAAQQASITIDHRASNRVLYVGGAGRYECTLLLLPGWLPFRPPYSHYPDVPASDLPSGYVLEDVAQTEGGIRDARDYWWERLGPGFDKEIDENGIERAVSAHHASHPMHHSVADVGRKWIFPSDWRYGAPVRGEPADSPYYREGLLSLNYEPFLLDGTNRLADPDVGGGIADAAARHWVARRRPFGSPIARLQAGSTQQPLVQFRVGDTPFASEGWTDLPVQFRLDERDSAIYIEVDNLLTAVPRDGNPADYADNWYAWIAEQRLWLRITCTVEGDDRLLLDARTDGPFQRRRAKIVDVGNRFRLHRRRGNNSIFDALPIDPDQEFEDIVDLDGDEGPMRDFGVADAEGVSRHVCSGNPEIPWLEYELQLGDSFSGIDGLGIVFPHPPELVGIQWVIDGNAGHRTQLMLSDMRSDPTLDLEAST